MAFKVSRLSLVRHSPDLRIIFLSLFILAVVQLTFGEVQVPACNTLPPSTMRWVCAILLLSLAVLTFAQNAENLGRQIGGVGDFQPDMELLRQMFGRQGGSAQREKRFYPGNDYQQGGNTWGNPWGGQMSYGGGWG